MPVHFEAFFAFIFSPKNLRMKKCDIKLINDEIRLLPVATHTTNPNWIQVEANMIHQSQTVQFWIYSPSSSWLLLQQQLSTSGFGNQFTQLFWDWYFAVKFSGPWNSGTTELSLHKSMFTTFIRWSLSSHTKMPNEMSTNRIMKNLSAYVSRLVMRHGITSAKYYYICV